MKEWVKKLYQHLVDFIYPQICAACGKQTSDNESAICFDCIWQLPRTNSHKSDSSPFTLRVAGKVKVENVYVFLAFSKRGKVQNLLHHLKYRNQPQLAEFLGKLYGQDLLNLKHQWDVIVPIPLHAQRLQERGYNQAEEFAKGLASVLNIPLELEALKRVKYTSTQTKVKGRQHRYENLADAFIVNDSLSSIKNNRVLLVDDVLTTGATLEAAGKQLLNAGAIKLYMLTLAAA